MPAKKPAENAIKANKKDNSSQRRRYDSPTRRRQIAETKERIISAGANLVHASPTWDLNDLSSRAIVEISGVGMRTLKRYFPTERSLRDAVLQRLVAESGIPLDGSQLDSFSDVIRQLFTYLSKFAARPLTAPITDPSLISMDQQRRSFLLAIMARETPNWSVRETESVAALLDVLWHQPTFERLTISWGLDSTLSIKALTWLADLIIDAVHQGKHP